MRGSEEGRICVKRFRKTSPSPKPPDATGVRDRPTGCHPERSWAPGSCLHAPSFPGIPGRGGGILPKPCSLPCWSEFRCTPLLPGKDSSPQPPSIWGHSCIPPSKKSLLKSQWLSLQTCCVCQELYRQSGTRWAEGLGSSEQQTRTNSHSPTCTLWSPLARGGPRLRGWWIQTPPAGTNIPPGASPKRLPEHSPAGLDRRSGCPTLPSPPAFPYSDLWPLFSWGRGDPAL